MGNVRLLLVLLSALVVVTGTALAYRQTGRALEPVRSIASMARSISEHDLHRRVDIVVPPDELGELVATFNGMLARLDDSFEGLRRFTADASHELRTPLALMRTELDGALARERDPKENRRVLLEVQQEVERMSRLVDRLLMLARADAGVIRHIRGKQRWAAAVEDRDRVLNPGHARAHERHRLDRRVQVPDRE